MSVYVYNKIFVENKTFLMTVLVKYSLWRFREKSNLVFLDLFDPPDDRDDDAEGESVEEHKSVIMHLLSQVRLGMDLTKVNLPTVASGEGEECPEFCINCFNTQW